MTSSERNVDQTTTSMNMVALNNLVVSLRPFVKKCRVQVVHKLTKQIKTLQKKKGSDQQLEANKKKAARLGREINVLKTVKVDMIGKHALANTTMVDKMSDKEPLDTKVMTRIACQKALQQRVAKWRSEHEDWQSLAAFLLYKNTGRRMKKKKPANDVTQTMKGHSDNSFSPRIPKGAANVKDMSPERYSSLCQGLSRETVLGSDSAYEEGTTNINERLSRLAGESESEDSSSASEDNRGKYVKLPKTVNSEQKQSHSESSDENSDGSTEHSDGEEMTEETSFVVPVTFTDSVTDQVSHTSESCETSEDMDGSDEESVSDEEKETQFSDFKDPKFVSNSENYSEQKVTRQQSSCDMKENKSTKGNDSDRSQLKPEMVVQKFSLSDLGADVENLPVPAQQPKLAYKCDSTDADKDSEIGFLFQNEEKDTTDKHMRKVKSKRDPFFVGGGYDQASSDSSDDDSESDCDKGVTMRGPSSTFESTFLGTLSGVPDHDKKRSKAHRAGQDTAFSDNSVNQSAKFAKGLGGRSEGSQKAKSAPAKTAGKGLDKSMLHPSWEASRKRKQEMNCIQAFKGKKITFDD